MASAVWMPWPISACAITSDTASPGPTRSQPFKGTVPSADANASLPPSRLRGGSKPQPSSKAGPATRALTMRRRRFKTGDNQGLGGPGPMLPWAWPSGCVRSCGLSAAQAFERLRRAGH